MVGGGAVAEAVGGVEEGDVAVAGGGLVAGGVADEDGVTELIAIDQHTEVVRLGQTGVAPALEVAKAATEPRPLEEGLAPLGDDSVVLELRLGRKRLDVRLGEAGEDLADTLVVRLANTTASITGCLA